ncbi:MAG: phosphoglycerate kinase [Candidatus Levybacteria bacterium]|nr:phosphoglycerate kinase [Candidatus Levybacteria bacterium]
MQLPNLKDAKIEGKRVLLRLDLDVPVQNGVIKDDSRLKAGLPTLEFLLKSGAKVIIAGHLGRPTPLNNESRIKNPFDFVQGRQELSLKPVALWFAKKISNVHNSSFIIHNSNLGGFDGRKLTKNLFLLENLRFYKGEEENPSTNSGQVFAKKLAALADIYVNDAFAVSHRNNASIVGVTKFLPHFAGFQLQKEVEVLSGILENPKRPLVVIIGGAKLETKLPLVEKMHHIADYVLVGGKLAGDVKTLLKVQHEKIKGRKSVLLVADLNEEGIDITPKSAENFLQIISLAKTAVWNGPMGKISDSKSEIIKSEEGSKKLAEGLIKSSAYTVVGGGDTVGFLDKICLLDNFACMPKNRCFLSTGGGAMLAFLSGETLPGIEALLKVTVR